MNVWTLQQVAQIGDSTTIFGDAPNPTGRAAGQPAVGGSASSGMCWAGHL